MECCPAPSPPQRDFFPVHITQSVALLKKLELAAKCGVMRYRTFWKMKICQRFSIYILEFLYFFLFKERSEVLGRASRSL